MSEWHPINTAPKDGTDVLLMGGHNSGRWRRVGFWATKVERWSVDSVVVLSEPTHWLAIPADPPARLPEADQANYPCDDCGRPRTAEQGGKVFTVCDDCWDRHYAKLKAARLSEGQEP